MNERIRQINFTIKVLNQKIAVLKEKLTSGLPTNVFDRVSEFVRVAQLSQNNATKNRQIEKFVKYKISRADKDINWHKSSESVDAKIKQKWVKNYSDRDLSQPEVSVLAKGLGFSVTPEKISTADIITAKETVIKQGKLDHSKAENLRHKIITTI